MPGVALCSLIVHATDEWQSQPDNAHSLFHGNMFRLIIGSVRPTLEPRWLQKERSSIYIYTYMQL